MTEHNADTCPTTARLLRMEDKLDKLVDVVAQLARIEERSSNQQEAQSRADKRIDNHETRLEKMEIIHAVNTGITKSAKWLWMFLMAVGGYFLGGKF